MIIDIHTHPPTDRSQWPEYLAQMRNTGTTLALVSVLPANLDACTEDELRSCNDDAAALTALNPDAVRWLAFVSPLLHANTGKELARCLDAGALGVKLLHPLKDADGSLDRCLPVLEEAGRRGVPVLIHTFNVTDGNVPGNLNIRDFASLAAAAPQTKLIAAHAGGNWRTSLPWLRRCGPNVFVDISGFYPERGLVESLVEALGAERCLYGSDAPGRNPVSQVAKVMVSGLTENDRDLILWRNAARIFRIAWNGTPTAPAATTTSRDLPFDPTVDHFCFCGYWPHFPTPCATPAELDDALAHHGIHQAFVADIGATQRIDLLTANAAFLNAAAKCRRVRPLAVVNPRTCDWPEILEAAGAGYAGAWVSPFLHNWRLDDPAHAGFFQACARAGVPLWINCALHDIRVRHTGAAWRATTAEDLLHFASAAPANRYVFQGVPGGPMRKILSVPRPGITLRFEVSRLTDIGTAFAQMRNAAPAGTLVLGSEFPFRDMRTVSWVAGRCR